MAESNGKAPKVLGLLCSLRSNGNSEVLLQRTLAAAREAGADTELLRMEEAHIAPCDGCLGCQKTGVCLVKDDMQEWLTKVEEAEALVFATPVFYQTMPGATKILMDRLYPLYIKGKLTNKVGAVIAAVSSFGQTGVWQVFNNFFNATHMLAADFVYTYARDKGDVWRDRHALKASVLLGKQVVSLATSGFRYPPEFPTAISRMVRERYQIDSSPAGNRVDPLASAVGTGSAPPPLVTISRGLGDVADGEGNGKVVKVLGVVCSLRTGSNSELLLQRSLLAAREAGAETEQLSLQGANIAPCDGCYGCSKTGLCVQKDDMEAWLPKFAQADAIIFATPVFFWTVPGATRVLMDRLFPLYYQCGMAGKVGAVIATAPNSGHTGVWEVFSTFFTAGHMLSADFVYAFARQKGEARRDRHAMLASMELGKQVVELVRISFQYPPDFPRAIVRLVRQKYGVDQSPAKGRFES